MEKIIPKVDFCDNPERMVVRNLLMNCGVCEISYISNGGVLLAVPDDNEGLHCIRAIMKSFGYHRTSDVYFPLGTDKPPVNCRHDGNYHGSKGFWRYWKFHPNTENEVENAA